MSIPVFRSMVSTLPPDIALADPTLSQSAQNAATARKWALIGVGVNVVFAVAKLTGGVLGHSYALIADGIQSSLDVAGALVIWTGLKFASKAPDSRHPYGHGKAEPISALVVSTALTGIALVLIALSARAVLAPNPVRPALGTLGVLITVIVVKELLFRRIFALGEEFGSTAVRTNAWTHRADAITSVAALVGIVIARVGGPGWEKADAWAALFACGVIGYNGSRLLVPAVAEIMDTAPDPQITRRVREAAEQARGVSEVARCRVRKMGLEFYVDLHIGVEGTLSVAAGHDIAHEVQDAVHAAEPRVADVIVHVEPADPRLLPHES